MEGLVALVSHVALCVTKTYTVYMYTQITHKQNTISLIFSRL